MGEVTLVETEEDAEIMNRAYDYWIDKCQMSKARPLIREMLGIDPLEIGNEGKVVLAVVPEMAEMVLAALQTMPEGKNARIIGTASAEIDGVAMETHTSGRRLIEPPVGDPVPRIC